MLILNYILNEDLHMNYFTYEYICKICIHIIYVFYIFNEYINFLFEFLFSKKLQLNY